MKKNQYELDHATSVFAYGYSEMRKSNIRLTVTVNQEIDSKILQISSDQIVKKYPDFFVYIVETRSNIKLAPLEELPKVLEDHSNFLNMSWKDMKKKAVNIFYTKHTVTLEYFHGISDANGGFFILKELINHYFGLVNQKELSFDGSQNQYDFQNAYESMISSKKIKKIKYSQMKTTFFINSPQDVRRLKKTTYEVDLTEIKNLATNHKVTVTQLLAAIQIEALNRIKKNNDSKRSNRIKLSIPVNLRNYYKSSTLRNFVWNIDVAPVVSDEKNNICDLAQDIHLDMNKKLNRYYLEDFISPTVKLASLKIVRRLPIRIKKLFIKTSLNYLGQKTTMTMSNLGIKKFPIEIEGEIKDITMMFSPKPKSAYSCGIVSYNNKLSITYVRALNTPVLERMVEDVLDELNIQYKKMA